ncbi:MAG: hypothetical protein IPH48_14185 [bacterium]|nr:hypothetical protein [bacterium]
MSPTPDNHQETLDQLRAARLAGQLTLALGGVSKALAAPGVHPAVLAEAIRVLILAGKADTAARLRLLLTGAENRTADHDLEPAAVARLALQLGQPELLAGLPAVDSPPWLVRLQADGEDIRAPFAIGDLRVTVVNGPAVYTLVGACPWCGQVRRFELGVTLLVHMSSLCLACFGTFELTWDGLRTFIRARFPDLVDARASAGDVELVEHVRSRLLESDEVPEIVRMLGQEYLFLLNELLVRRLMTEAAPPAGERP